MLDVESDEEGAVHAYELLTTEEIEKKQSSGGERGEVCLWCLRSREEE